MGRQVADGKKDADKGRAELISELNALRDFNSRLKDVVKRYERVAGKKELCSSLYDPESEKERIESLRNELREKETEVDIQGEELGVKNEEVRAQLDEINACTEEIVRISEALRESERQLSEGQMLTGTGSWEMELATGEVVFSDNMLRILSLSPGQHAYIEFTGRVHPEDRERRDVAMKEAIDNGKRYDIMYRIILPDNNVRHIHAIGSVALDARGEPVKFTSTIQDITERKRAEEALRESEEKFRSLAESTLAGVSLYRGAKRIYANPALEKITGYTNAELLTMDFWDVVRPDYRELARQRGLDRQRGLSVPSAYEVPIVTKGGETRWVEVSGARIKYQNENMSLATLYDITERKRAEEARLQLASIVESSSNAIISKTLDGVITSWNKGAEQVYGYKMEEVIGKPVSMLAPQDHPDEVPQIIEKIKHGENIVYFDTKRVRKDGTIIDVSLTVSPIKDLDGRVIGAATIARDITESKRAEEALREREYELRSFVDASVDGIIIMDNDGKILQCNHSYESITGLGSKDVVGQFGWEVQIGLLAPERRTPEIRERLKKVLLETLSSDDPKQRKRQSEVTLFRPDGQRRIIMYNSYPVDTANKRMIGAIIRDITERKRAEEALRKSEEKFRLLADFTGDMESWISPKGDYIYVSPSYERTTGYSVEEFYRDPGLMTKLIHLDDRAAYDQHIIGHFNNTANSSIDFRIVTASGETRWINHHCQPVFGNNGEWLGRRMSNRDITERKRAEEELREMRDYLESLIKYANAPIIVWDPEFTITQFNHAFERLSGYETGEVVGKNLKMLFPPGSIDESMDNIRSTLTGERWESVEIPILRKDGSTRIALWNSANIQGGKGELLATIAQGQDITERKRAERELSDAKAQVELYLDLMGHDINNMNMVAAGFLEIARNAIDCEGKLDSSEVDLLDSAMASINSSSRLIGNVRKLQRDRMGEYKSEVYDLGALVGEVCEQYRSVPDRQVSISFGKASGIRVQANELIRDVFVNLIGNAIKHSKGPSVIDVRINPEKMDGCQYCTVSVEDNGPGIPDVMKDVIFDRFRRGDTKAHGSGLGLYLVKTLVDSYGGKVWVEDRVKGDYTQGARFVIMLPVVDS
jgi:PAS domain S-box-containing protein